MARTRSMSFQTNHGKKLKNSIESLSQSNPKGSGIIDIDPNYGFRISSITDSNTGLINFVLFEPSNLVDFYCSKAVKNKLVNLKFLLRMLQAIEEDSIILYIEDGSSNLSFEAVACPGLALGVGLQASNADFKAYSGVMSPTCEAVLPTEGLRSIIPEMVKDGFTQVVSMDITSAETKISIGNTEWEFKSNTEIGEKTSMESEQRHHVEFLWSQVDSLTKATSLSEKCSFALLPTNNIMLQFRFEEGSLVYIKRPLCLVLTTH